jgi:protein-arginine kinase activator protein McsA
MKKTALLLLLSVLIQFRTFAQSNEYSFITTSDLQTQKAEVIKKTDYSTAAKIQVELDKRNAEAKSLSDLKKKLELAVNAQDYSKAAALNEEIKSLNQKNELRLQIEEALKKEDYDKAAVAKEKLRVILDGNNTALQKTVVPNTAPQENPAQTVINTLPKPGLPSKNVVTTNANNSFTNSRNLTAWSCGMNAPFGVMSGSLNMSSVGLYFNYRSNLNGYEFSDQKMIDGVIDNSSWIYDYNGLSRYSRLEVNLGLTKRISGDLDEFGVFGYTGIGFTRFRYLYEFDEFGPSTGTNYGTRVVIDETYSGWNLNVEGGIIFNFNQFNIHSGIVLGMPNFGQSMFVIGIGYSSK